MHTTLRSWSPTVAWLAVLGIAATLGIAACTGAIMDPPASPGPEVDPLIASESGARRLTQAELDRSLDDLLGDDTNPARRLLGEDEFNPYDNDYTLQEASQTLIENLEVMSKDVADRLIADPARRDRLVGCTPTGPGDEACFRSFVSSFLRRAFRRDVPMTEIDPYVEELLPYATEDNPDVENDFYTAVALVIRSVLQDPEFLYRIETGETTPDDGVFRIDAYDVAARMSYLIWGTTPDDQLLADADEGRLDDAEGRRAAGERMFLDPKAREQMRRFHAMWLGYRSIPHDATLVAAFDRETSALIDRVVFEEERSYLDLFTLDETFADATLATHYGLPAPSDPMGAWVPYGDTGRSGILGHGSVLSAFSKFTDTSPTQRGIFVRTRMMCLPILRPPPTVDVDQPPMGDDEAVCKADRYSAHRTIASCASCHDQMDPIGFGLERFDIAGRYREAEEALPACEIDGRGELPGVGPFSGPAELGRLLVDGGFVDACFVEQWLTYALGRPLSRNEDVLVDQLTADLRGGSHRLRDWILAFVASDRFVLRAEER